MDRPTLASVDVLGPALELERSAIPDLDASPPDAADGWDCEPTGEDGWEDCDEALVEADCDVHGHLLVLLDGSDDCDGGQHDDPTDTDTSDEGEVLADCDGDQARAALVDEHFDHPVSDWWWRRWVAAGLIDDPPAIGLVDCDGVSP